jgi:hypothetical protein
MPLVILAPGISVKPEMVDFILVERDRNKTGYTATILHERLAVVGLSFTTPAEAELVVADWTAKINGETIAPTVPTIEDPHETATSIVQAVLNELRDTSDTVERALDNFSAMDYAELLRNLDAQVLSLLGGTA